MTDIELPLQHEKTRIYRFLEMLPGLLTYSILALPIVLSFYQPRLAVFFIIFYILVWFAKALALNVRAIQGWNQMNRHKILPWAVMLEELALGKTIDKKLNRPDWHLKHLDDKNSGKKFMNPDDIWHIVIIATWNESRDVIEPTIKAVANSNYDTDKIILVIAYEERGGEAIKQQTKQLISEYKDSFHYAACFEHPDGMKDEVIGKGGNITYAARQINKYIEANKIDPKNVIVTTLDSDNRPHHNYFAALSYTYCVSPDPVRTSYQPIPMFTNNIWDAPAPMRVIATGNSFWMVVQALRPHMLRNFASHSQSLQALIDTDYWSVRSIVEDGHQFWRTYFRYDGKHDVYPIFLPNYQDAVLASGYRKTLKAQFIQLRRWAYGASDIPYVITKAFLSGNKKLPKYDAIVKFLRLLEGHVSWATAPIILAFSAFIPLLVNPDDIAANQLPLIISRIQQVAMSGIVITLFLSLRTLPPRPLRYKRHRTIWMVLQWLYLPITTIVYSSFAALNSQTRLLFGWYLGKFDLTEKAVKK